MTFVETALVDLNFNTLYLAKAASRLELYAYEAEISCPSYSFHNMAAKSFVFKTQTEVRKRLYS